MPKRVRRRAIPERQDQDRGALVASEIAPESEHDHPANDATLTPSNVLRLQNRVGNQAVQRLITQQQKSAPTNVVQRSSIFDWMMDTAESIAQPYIDYGKLIWEAAEAEKKRQAAAQAAAQAGVGAVTGAASSATDPAIAALEEAVETEVKLSEAKLLSADKAKVERQRALDQARFTEEEQKEIDALGIEKLGAELKTKKKELGLLNTALGTSKATLKKLKPKVKKDPTIQTQIDKLNTAIETQNADKDKLDSRIAALEAILRKNKYKGAMEKMEKALGGKEGLVKWFDDFDANATFLGLKVMDSDKSRVAGVHKKMTTALQKAEAHLLALPQFAGKEPIEVAEALGIYRVSGLRQPKDATGKDNISLHCYGLAIDINATTNPYVGLHTYEKEGEKEKRSYTAEAIVRAAQALGRPEKNIRTQPSKDAGEMWEFLNEASDMLRDYIALLKDEAALQAAAERLTAAGQSKTAAELKTQIEEDVKWLKAGDFNAATDKGDENRDPSHGFMDLKKELVVALVDAGLTWGGMFMLGKDIQHFQLNGEVSGDDSH